MLERYGAQRSVDLAATAAAEKQNEAKAESAAQEDDAANRTPYLIGWFNNPSIARWAAILKRDFEKRFPAYAGATVLGTTQISMVMSVVILISPDFTSMPGFQEVLISATEQAIPIILLWRSTTRVRTMADMKLIVSKELHFKALHAFRQAVLLEYKDYDDAHSFRKLMKYLQDGCMATRRYAEMKSLLNRRTGGSSTRPLSAPSEDLKKFLEPLKVSKEIFVAISSSNFELLRSLSEHVEHPNELLRVYDLTRELTRTMNMLQFAQGRKRQDMIDFLKSEVLRLQGAVEEQRTTVSGQICQAVLNEIRPPCGEYRKNPTMSTTVTRGRLSPPWRKMRRPINCDHDRQRMSSDGCSTK